jgi:diguanylate cyclase (GGDEF)-like protein
MRVLLVPVIRTVLRQDALLTRFGGEEFAMLVPVANQATGGRVAERLRLAVADADFFADGQRLAVTASLDLAMLTPGETLDAVLRRADEALYRAKRAGRNRVSTASG